MKSKVNTWVLRLIAFTIFSLCSANTMADKFVIGAQRLDYFPHYDFTSSRDRGVAWAILEAFSKYSGHELVYLSLPVKRLQIELQKGNIDFVFPDNPRWDNGIQATQKKVFSEPLVHTLTGSFLTEEKRGHTISSIKTLAVPKGFTPVKWKQRINSNLVKVIEVDDVYEGLQLVNQGKADAIDLEYHVVDYFVKRYPQLAGIELDITLPYKDVPFQLSTVNQPEVIAQLNQFLIEHASEVSQIVKSYQIKQPDALVNQLTLGINETANNQ